MATKEELEMTIAELRERIVEVGAKLQVAYKDTQRAESERSAMASELNSWKSSNVELRERLILISGAIRMRLARCRDNMSGKTDDSDDAKELTTIIEMIGNPFSYHV